MSKLDINLIISNALEALQPIAKERNIQLKFASKQMQMDSGLPIDNIVPPIFQMSLKLLYILPKDKKIEVTTLERFDPELQIFMFRAEIKTQYLPMNPNMILNSASHHLKMVHNEKNEPIIYIEWPIQNPIQRKEDAADESLPGSLDVGQVSNSNLLSLIVDTNEMSERMQAHTNNHFVKQKLNSVITKKDAAFMEKVIATIIHTMDDKDFNSDSLSRIIGISKAQLFRKLKALVGFSTANYIRHVKLHKAAELLESTPLNITEVSQIVGFNELSYFSSSFQKTFEISPSEWRRIKTLKQ